MGACLCGINETRRSMCGASDPRGQASINKATTPPTRPPPMPADKECVWAAVQENGLALEYADNTLKSDKDVVLTAVLHNGLALEYADDTLKSDMEVVLAAVKNNGTALKFAKAGLNQNSNCLKAAGLLDEVENMAYIRPEKATLSVMFSLAEESTTYATEFALRMRSDNFLKQFKTHNPNTCLQDSCDPNFTRFHQLESKLTNGFMIQVEEQSGLGDRQKTESEIAKEVKVKVFRTYTDSGILDWEGMGRISKAVEEWYQGGCANLDIENVFIGQNRSLVRIRPKYERP